jgi:hypothetical protein
MVGFRDCSIDLAILEFMEQTVPAMSAGNTAEPLSPIMHGYLCALALNEEPIIVNETPFVK